MASATISAESCRTQGIAPAWRGGRSRSGTHNPTGGLRLEPRQSGGSHMTSGSTSTAAGNIRSRFPIRCLGRDHRDIAADGLEHRPMRPGQCQRPCRNPSRQTASRTPDRPPHFECSDDDRRVQAMNIDDNDVIISAQDGRIVTGVADHNPTNGNLKLRQQPTCPGRAAYIQASAKKSPQAR